MYRKTHQLTCRSPVHLSIFRVQSRLSDIAAILALQLSFPLDHRELLFLHMAAALLLASPEAKPPFLNAHHHPAPSNFGFLCEFSRLTVCLCFKH